MGHRRLVIIELSFEIQRKNSSFFGHSKSQISFQAKDTLKVVLFNITADPTEHEDLSGKLPDVVEKMQERVKEYMKGVVPALFGPLDPRAAVKALYEGVWTPWQD